MKGRITMMKGKLRLAALLTAAITVVTAASAQLADAGINAAGAVPGDINSDGTVNTADIGMLQKHLTASSSLTVRQRKAADMDGSGSLNTLDLALLKKQLLHSTGNEKFGGLVINEVCTSNKASLSDASGAEPDWIEIYNSSDHAMTLDGVGVSDGAKNKFKYAFPSGTVIPADGYLIVFCDDGLNPAEGEHHAPFKLSASGETVYLTHPQYGEIDSVAAPELDTDTSYGRYKNGSSTFAYLECTPAASNDTAAILNVVEKPVFSAEGGFYDTAFDLSLSDPNGNEIWYTTDGSDPASSDTAKKYTGAINIYNNTSDPNVWSAVRAISLMGYTPPSSKVDKGIVIRAVCRTSDGRCSGTATNSYFVGKTASYYSDMKVISIATDSDYLFNEDTGAYMIGSGYYEWVNSSEYVEYEQSDVQNPTNYNKDGKESEFPVNIQVFENGKAEYSSDVGARIAGNWTRSYPQKSIRLYARSEYGDSRMRYAFFDELTDINGNKIKEFDKITLSNGGGDCPYLHFRDALIQDIAEDGGLSVGYMASEPCIVFIDGEFWGFYLMREKVDGDYIEARYGISKDDAAVIKNGSIEEGTDADTAEFDDFCKWAVSADMTDEANYKKACDTVDMESFMDYVALETYICNSDWAPTYLNNWIAWKSRTVDPSIPEADGKWRFVLYDTDNSAGLYYAAESSYSYDMLNNLYDTSHWCNFPAVFYNLMNNEDFRDRFYENYTDVIDNCFDTARVSAKIDEYETAYRTATLASQKRFNFTWYKSYDDELNHLRDFFNNRPYYARLYLDKLCSTTTVNPAPDDPDPDIDTTTNLISDPSRWWMYDVNGDSSLNVIDANSISATVNTLPANTYDIQVSYGGISITAGETYTYSFTVSSTAETQIKAKIEQNSGDYNNYCEAYPAAGAKPVIYTETFTATEDCSNTKLCFNLGYSTGTYTISDIVWVKHG